MYFVYLIKSLKINRFYIGSTTDCNRRLLEHNSGSTKSTKPYRPWELVYTEVYNTKIEANKREWYLKHTKGYLEKLKIIKEYNK